MDLREIALHKAASLINLIAARRQIIFIHAKRLRAVQCCVSFCDAAHIRSFGVKRCIFHLILLADPLFLIIGQFRHAAWQSVVHPVIAVALL